MSEKKSKLPDLKELGTMTSKLFKDIKKSVTEIIQDYKDQRVESAEETAKAKEEPPKKNAPSAKETKPKTAKARDNAPDLEIKKESKPEEIVTQTPKETTKPSAPKNKSSEDDAEKKD